jgi:Methyltransferase domain
VNLYQHILGIPWIYDNVRPFLVGGINFQEGYSWLDLKPEDIVIDVGCGTGAAFDYIDPQTCYHGFDTDERALNKLRQNHPGPNVHLYPTCLTEADVSRIRPTKVMLFGLIHHVSDNDTLSLLAALASSTTVQRIVSADVIFRPGKWINNLLASLDRGRHVRTEKGYRDLIAGSPFAIRDTKLLQSGNGAAKYFVMCMEPNRA